MVPAIGEQFQQLLKQRNLDPSQCPVLAATKQSAANAIGRKNQNLANTTSPLLRLAKAVVDFHCPSDSKDRINALEAFHEVMLERAGKLPTKNGKKTKTSKRDEKHLEPRHTPRAKRRTYHQYLIEEKVQPETWRPLVISHIRELAPNPGAMPANVRVWHDRARQLLEAKTGSDLRYDPRLEDLLALPASGGLKGRTIHSVKGLEFPAVCIVMTEANHILDLHSDAPNEHMESAREIYVGISRAQILLALAIPKSQAKRLQHHLDKAGVQVEFIDLSQEDGQSPTAQNKRRSKGQANRGSITSTTASRTTKSAQRQAKMPNPDSSENRQFQLPLL